MNNKDELSKIIEKFSPKRTFTRMHDKIYNDNIDDDIYPRTIIWSKDQDPPPIMKASYGNWQHPTPCWFPSQNNYVQILYYEEIKKITDKERDEAIYNLACILYQQNTETE